MPLLGMEAEIGFRFLRDAAPRTEPYSRDEVAERVIAFPALEIVATRYADYKGTPLIERTADVMSNGAYVVGDERPDWRVVRPGEHRRRAHRSATRSSSATERRPHGRRSTEGHAVDLVNVLRSGSGVAAGQIMTTGTYTELNFATAGVRVRAAFEGFGSAEVDIA